MALMYLEKPQTWLPWIYDMLVKNGSVCSLLSLPRLWLKGGPWELPPAFLLFLLAD